MLKPNENPTACRGSIKVEYYPYMDIKDALVR